MKLDTLRDLEAAIKLCRRLGVKALTVNGVQVELGEPPHKTKRLKSDDKAEIAPTGPTDEEMLFWSSQE